ncbi:hypothetical protein [Rhizobium sp. TRM95796]|uniref:hypothetical protein n=1 Tax=Rhizobium sp. TRM95796 TaxID=2979862 RepID=UPI0021E8D4EA|nr:hypothetical protein [Rhizobium sp. TRM95796]MCV3765727.1 hypothetical protein [Rhizobium sp. TRM95796]
MNTSIVGNGIDVVVRANDGAMVRNWMSYNSEWLGAFEAKIWWCSHEASGLTVRTFDDGVSEEGRQFEDTGPEISSRPLLFVAPDWMLRPDWLTHIARAHTLRPFWSATGRLVVQAADGRAGLGDTTPTQIGHHVRSWSFAPSMHGICADELPTDVLWVSPEAKSMFLAAIRFETNYDEAASRFFNSAAQHAAHGTHVYLPDAVAVRVSVIQ